jgi:2-oxoglutarate ferredoxin oxidoreductase subunit alpha
MRRNDLVIRIAGESGEGVVSTGDLVTQAAARAGFEVLTFKTFPAEIKGGHVIFQLRLSDEPLTAPGDTIDILLAFNQEAYDTSYGLLRDNGLLIYDSGAFNPPADERCRHKAVPLTEIAKTQLKFELGKNVVAVGVVAAMFGLDVGWIASSAIRSRRPARSWSSWRPSCPRRAAWRCRPRMRCRPWAWCSGPPTPGRRR